MKGEAGRPLHNEKPKQVNASTPPAKLETMQPAGWGSPFHICTVSIPDSSHKIWGSFTNVSEVLTSVAEQNHSKLLYYN